IQIGTILRSESAFFYEVKLAFLFFVVIGGAFSNIGAKLRLTIIMAFIFYFHFRTLVNFFRSGGPRVGMISTDTMVGVLQCGQMPFRKGSVCLGSANGGTTNPGN